MKRIFGMLLTIAVAMAMVNMLYAEEVADEELAKIGLEKIYFSQCVKYVGHVLQLKTVVKTPLNIIPKNGEEIASEEAKIYPYPRSPYTVTRFTVRLLDENAEYVLRDEVIENGNGQDMSAMIAVVQEAFTSGESIVVYKCYEPVQPLYDKLDALKKELAGLPSTYFRKRMELYCKWFFNLPEVVELRALLNAGKITPTEYTIRFNELRNKYYVPRANELAQWYAETKASLENQIASLEAKIDYILNNPKLVGISVEHGMIKLEPIIRVYE